MKRDLDLEAIVAAAMEDGLGPETGDSSLPKTPLAQFQKMAMSLRVAHFDAPISALEAAKALMPERERRSILARLVSSSLALSGVRAAAADNFQLVFEVEPHRIRLLYVREANGWEVAGQAPAGWRVERGGRAIRQDASGRFHFRAARLSGTGLTLIEDGLAVLIPPADQAKLYDSRNAD